MNLIETIRHNVVEHETKKAAWLTGKKQTDGTKPKIAVWEQRRAVLMSGMPTDGASLTKTHILNIADKLSEAFLVVGNGGGRTQEDLSGGGSSWGALVCWYLNICLAGTDAIALTKKFVPRYINDA